MSRTLRQRFTASAGAVIALASLPLFAFADTQIFARGWSHQDFGRLVLDHAARLATGAEIKGHKLVVAFSEPVSVKLDTALANLKGYVDGPSSAAGQTLELTLARPATLSQFVDEGNLVLDLKPAGAWPSKPSKTADMAAADLGAETKKAEPADETSGFETGAGTQTAEKPTTETPKTEAPRTEPPKAQPAPPAKTELAPVPNVTASPTKIVARHGDHGTFVRLAIDWPGKIDYRITREGDRFAITFTAPANIDLGPAAEDLPKELTQIAAVNEWDPLESTCRHASLSIL